MVDTLPKGGALVAALMKDGPNYKQGYSFANAINGVAEREHAPDPIEVAILARDAVLAVLDDHMPHLDDETEELLVQMAADLGNTDISDLAKRTCACGYVIDGFYDYVGHLRQVFSER